MKVTHICTSLSGGAGLCALRIIKATRAKGIDARALVMSGNKDEITEIIKYNYPWSSWRLIRKGQAALSLFGLWPKDIRENNKINNIINEEKAKCDNNPTFTSPTTIYKHIADHPWVKDADLIHLHWIGKFVDYSSFFTHVDKPLIWTLHDENPGLGGFHYTFWKEMAPNSFQRYDNELMAIKEKAYKKVHNSMTLVAISSSMVDFIKNNILLKSFPHTLIHNGVDVDAFKMVPKSSARNVLSIPENKAVFLFSAYDIHEDRKGLKELVSALTQSGLSDIMLICLGNYKEKPQAPFEIRCEGFVSNSRLLSIYYSAADFFMLPSFQEGFAQTPLEAMSCGTPVISFPCGCANDLINEINGIVCKDFTVEDLKDAIRQALSKKYDRDEIREFLKTHFSYDIIAQQYIELYYSVLAENL